MKATTKYKLHKIVKVVMMVLVWLICIVPIAIAYPFYWLLTQYFEWMDKSDIKLRKKYNVGHYSAPDNKTILKEIEDETR